MVKQFGKKNRVPVPRVPFEFHILRYGMEPESHTFNAVPRSDAAALARLLDDQENAPERTVPGMVRMISKMVDNTDGVPHGWKATVVQPPASEVADGDVAEQRAPYFIAPWGERKGQALPLTETAQFKDPAVWSSRRRWLALLDDDDVVIDGEDLAELFEWLIGLAAGRPTERSS